MFGWLCVASGVWIMVCGLWCVVVVCHRAGGVWSWFVAGGVSDGV